MSSEFVWPTADELLQAVNLPRRGDIVECQPHHVMGMELRDVDIGALGGGDIRAFADTLLAYPAKYAGLVEGECVVAFGFIPYWDGVAEGWMFTSKYLSRDKFIFHRAATKGIEYVYTYAGLRRLQFTIHSYNPLAIRWADVLGFNLEGRLRKYGPDGADYFMYSKVTK